MHFQRGGSEQLSPRFRNVVSRYGRKLAKKSALRFGLLVTSLACALGIANQLWLEKIDGSGAKAITTIQVFTQAAYHWDPTSVELVFQRLELGTSQARPEVVVWNRVMGTFTVIDQDAGLPEWLP